MPDRKLFRRQFMAGGEFVINPLLALSIRKGQFSAYGNSFSEYHRYYTFGAYYSLKAILANLDLSGTDKVLLPSYLCPSILIPFKEAGINYFFYKLKEGLLPNLEDIEAKLTNDVKAVFFIDYFGVSYRQYLAPLLQLLKQRRIHVIQDCVQAWLRDKQSLYGDFVFNSMRKYSPCEASVIFSKQPLNIAFRYDFERKFIIKKRLAQFIRYMHIRFGLFNPQAFLARISFFNEHYHQSGLLPLPSLNRFLLDRVDFNAWSEIRRETFNKLSEIVKNPTQSIKPSILDTPLGLSVQFDNRDNIKSMLQSQNVFCPVHWILSPEIDKQEFAYSWHVSVRELTLPVFIEPRDLTGYIQILKGVS